MVTGLVDATNEARYSRIEYERRFLVSPVADWRSAAEPYFKIFEDKYLLDSRLRLRVLTDSDTGRRVNKLTKKAESSSPYYSAINRILLSNRELELMDSLDGYRLSKRRYYHDHKGRVFSIDVFEGELAGLVLCETEAASLDELMLAEPPPFAGSEVTEDPFFTGGNLARTPRAELLERLAVFGIYPG
jgi:CYTH domain-containing protein